ncbi:MAG: tyrosine-type recombinase/integrase [Clostridia bacterium]|nr:tyrosine-type recombinase/integrase [Clostridia bacterium]
MYGNTSKYIINNEGKMTEPRYCQYHFAKILKKAKIKPAKFHTTRHTFATRALESGMDIKTLSEVLGHADATITMKRYAHSSDEQKRICIEKLADSVFNDYKYGQICG